MKLNSDDVEAFGKTQKREAGNQIGRRGQAGGRPICDYQKPKIEKSLNSSYIDKIVELCIKI